MDFFQRLIHSNVKKVDGDHYSVTSQLLDLEHSLHLELLVRISDREIIEASAAMSKTPFTRCLGAVDSVLVLKGLSVTRGIMGRINELLAGPMGCAHMLELILDAIRLLGMLLIGEKSEWDFTDPDQ